MTTTWKVGYLALGAALLALHLFTTVIEDGGSAVFRQIVVGLLAGVMGWTYAQEPLESQR